MTTSSPTTQKQAEMPELPANLNALNQWLLWEADRIDGAPWRGDRFIAEHVKVLRTWARSTSDALAYTASLQSKVDAMRAERDAWREVAEVQYGKLRSALYGDEDYPVLGALDAYAADRHECLKASNRYAALKESAA